MDGAESGAVNARRCDRAAERAWFQQGGGADSDGRIACGDSSLRCG